jgi:protein kinase A
MSPTERKEVADQEKQFVAHFSEQHETLPPEEVLQAPRNKELGRSSRALSVNDFELVRTLGTGSCLFLYYDLWRVECKVPCLVQLRGPGSWMHADDYCAVGTFARVWLVRLADPAPEDRDKVYALKVLRKVEGRSTRRTRTRDLC